MVTWYILKWFGVTTSRIIWGSNQLHEHRYWLFDGWVTVCGSSEHYGILEKRKNKSSPSINKYFIQYVQQNNVYIVSTIDEYLYTFLTSTCSISHAMTCGTNISHSKFDTTSILDMHVRSICLQVKSCFPRNLWHLLNDLCEQKLTEKFWMHFRQRQ